MKEEQLREDQRREALARQEEVHAEDTLPPPAPKVEEPRRVEEPVQQAEPSRYEEPRQREQPKVNPRELLESAGLVMIETDRSKAPPAPPVAQEPLHLGRPRRERPKSAPAQEDELVQIETAKK